MRSLIFHENIFILYRFGVCCVFVYDTTGATITQNCSYIRNPNYPNAYTDTGSLNFQIVKCDPSKQISCWLLLFLFLKLSFRIYFNPIQIQLHFLLIGVCYLRLDFESFDINGLTDSVEFTNANGPVTACTDTFTITVWCCIKKKDIC